MYKKYIKDGIISLLWVQDGKVYTTITMGDFTITNPTEEQFLSSGWEIYIEPTPEVILPTIEELTVGKLRERYSINQEFEVQRKRDIEPEAFQAYYTYVEECIAWAKQQPHRGEG